MLRSVTLIAVMLWSATTFGQSPDHPYFSLAVGPNFADTLSGNGADVTTGAGPVGNAELGWAFASGLSVGIDARVSANSVRNISTLRSNGQTLPLSNTGGDLLTPAVMANLSYQIKPADLGLISEWPVHPYIGAGLGYAWLHFVGAGGNEVARINLPDNNVFVGPSVVNYGTGSAFAYQASAGISVPLSMVPGVDATLEYRYFGTTRAEIVATARSTTSDLVNGMVPTGTRNHPFEAHDSAVLVGVRYAFGGL